VLLSDGVRLSNNILVRKAKTLWLRLRSRRAKDEARSASARAVADWRGDSVLIVCHGNIYRSAFVAEFLKQRFGAKLEILSAGFHPKAGRSSPERHVEMCARWGVDLRQHRSSVVDQAQLQRASLIVLMDRKNWVALQRCGVDSRRLAWLGAFAPGDVEVADPYGLDEPEAAKIVERLHACSEALAEELSRALGAGSLAR
jgi:protein-tyrosine-phosphatase